MQNRNGKGIKSNHGFQKKGIQHDALLIIPSIIEEQEVNM